MAVYEDADEYCPHCDNHYVRRFPALSRRWEGANGSWGTGGGCKDPPCGGPGRGRGRAGGFSVRALPGGRSEGANELRRMIVDARAKQKPLASDLDAFADQMG